MPGKRATSLFNSFSSKVVVFVVRFTVFLAQTYKIFNLSCTLFHALKSTTNQGRIQSKKFSTATILAYNDRTGDNETFEGIQCLALPGKFRQKEL